jgi:hypothetical protein
VAQPKTAAQAIYPHLPSGERPLVQTQRGPGLADAIFPGLSRQAKAAEAQQQRWDEWRKRNRDNHLRWLREANANLGRRR